MRYQFVCGFGIIAAICSAGTPTASAEDRPSTWPNQVFAPYVDVALWPPFDFSATAKQHGVKYYTLAFITAQQKKPCWGGYAQYNTVDSDFHRQIKERIAAVRHLGGDVMVSFGGAAGTELAMAHQDVAKLTAAYRSVIDAYALRCIDFDIEGAALADKNSIERRWQAIAALQANAEKRRERLTVWLTLPVLPSGLTDEGVAVVAAAIRHGVDIGGVNVMAMNYGDSAAPNPEGRMGDYTIQSATNTARQLQSLYGRRKGEAEIWQMIGVTPMIGMNDVTTEVFHQTDAKKLLAFAQENRIGKLSIWSLPRDRPHKNGAIQRVGPKFSSVEQEPFEFSQLLKAYRTSR